MYELNLDQIELVDGGLVKIIWHAAASEFVMFALQEMFEAGANMDLAAFGESMDNRNGGNMK